MNTHKHYNKKKEMLPSTWIGRGITLTWDIHILAAAYNADITVIIKHIMLQWLAQIF